MTVRDQLRLLMFKNRVLRKIIGNVYDTENNLYRIAINTKLRTETNVQEDLSGKRPAI